MNPGRLKDEVTIQQLVTTTSDTGETSEGWTLYAKRLGKITTPSFTQFQRGSKELVEPERTLRQNKWIVKLRHDPDVASSMRVLWLDHTLDIVGMTADPSNKSHMYLHCFETVPANQGFGELAGQAIMVMTDRTDSRVSNGDSFLVNQITIAVGQSQAEPVTATFTILNSGGAALQITTPLSLVGSPEGWSITGQPDASVAVDGTTTFTVSYTYPIEMSADFSGIQTFTATLAITSNDSVTPTFVLILTVEVTKA